MEFHIYHLSRALSALGIDSSVVRVSPEPGVHDAPEDVPFSYVDGARARSLGRLGDVIPGHYGPELVRRVAQNADAWHAARSFGRDADTVIHQHDFIGNLALTKLLARRHPVVWTNHLGEYLLLRRSRAGRYGIRWMTRHYRHAFAPSSELAAIPPMRGRVTQLSNAVDRELFPPATDQGRIEAREALGLASGDLVVLVPRRWAPTKGVAIAAEALGHLEGMTDRSISALFVGSSLSEYPDYARQVAASLDALDMDVRITPRATAAEMAALYRCADVTLVPSFLEATSLAALEAISAGSIVVASETGGLAELISHGENGFLHEPGDARALASLICEVASLGPDEAERIRQGAFRVADEHSWSGVASVVAQTYRSVLDERGR